MKYIQVINTYTHTCVPTDFNYNTDGYEGDGAEDRKSQDGSETMPFIDESPTMSPQLCVRPDGEAVSPTPPEGLLPGVSVSVYVQFVCSVVCINEKVKKFICFFRWFGLVSHWGKNSSASEMRHNRIHQNVWGRSKK